MKKFDLSKYTNTLKIIFDDGDEFRLPDISYGRFLESGFTLDEFKTSVVKYVHKNHLQTDEYWMNSVIVPNSLI